jgi:hypothetical protein
LNRTTKETNTRARNGVPGPVDPSNLFSKGAP